MSNLINELKAKSDRAAATKADISAEIIKIFEKCLDKQLEDEVRGRIGDTQIKERKVYMQVSFWEYHSGCSTTQFRCGGFTWYNPENHDGWESRTYKNFTLKDIHEPICKHLDNYLERKMHDLGFYTVERTHRISRLGYYETDFYFGW
jgi:hypothetical protein